MLMDKTLTSLSRILAIRMVVVSISVSLLLTLLFTVHYMSNTPGLREATLYANAAAIAQALNRKEDPAKLPIYTHYPQSYGFRAFDSRQLATRHILASANTRWLPPVQHLTATRSDPDGNRDLTRTGSDLVEGFERFRVSGAQGPGNGMVSLLVHRTIASGHKYWVQTSMVGDPAWLGAGVILGKLIVHVLLPVLFIVPALTLAMFLTTRRALRPLRKLSRDANVIGAAVARGQTLTPVSETGMAREFADVAAAINTVLAKLERSLQLQKQFTSDAAHELRTPLAVLLLEASRLPPGPARDRIKGDLSGLGYLVNELLRFAQAEDVMAHELNEVDIAAVARKVCEDLVARAIMQRQFIEFDFASSSVIVPGNAALIEIAIRNLVDNALKYSPPGSTVSVNVGAGPVVIVDDCGTGIPPAQRDAVFERFWRADPQSVNGAGVGLALVRRIAQLHDGSVQLEDRPAGGTRLVLSFVRTPVARDAMHKTFAL